MKRNILKTLAEYFAFTYFNWLVVVPSLIPFMIFWVGVTDKQLIDWLFMSIFTSMYIGWMTVKADNIFAPWFYRKMKMNKKTEDQIIVDRLKERIIDVVYPYYSGNGGLDVLTEFLKILTGNKKIKLIDLDGTTIMRLAHTKNMDEIKKILNE